MFSRISLSPDIDHRPIRMSRIRNEFSRTAIDEEVGGFQGGLANENLIAQDEAFLVDLAVHDLEQHRFRDVHFLLAAVSVLHGLGEWADEAELIGERGGDHAFHKTDVYQRVDFDSPHAIGLLKTFSNHTLVHCIRDPHYDANRRNLNATAGLMRQSIVDYLTLRYRTKHHLLALQSSATSDHSLRANTKSSSRSQALIIRRHTFSNRLRCAFVIRVFPFVHLSIHGGATGL
jgi:hypothetical protein